MKAAKKIVTRVLSAVVVLLVVLVIGFIIFGESMIKSAVETAASKALEWVLRLRMWIFRFCEARSVLRGWLSKIPRGMPMRI